MISTWDIRLAFTAREFIIFKINHHGKDFLILPHGVIDLSKEIVQANIVNEKNGTYSYEPTENVEIKVEDFKIVDIIDTVSKQHPSTISTIFQEFRKLLDLNSNDIIDLSIINTILKVTSAALDDYKDHRDFKKSEIFKSSINDLILKGNNIKSQDVDEVNNHYRDAVNTLSHHIMLFLSK